MLDGIYDLFLFEGRETTLSAQLTVPPSLTSFGRYRVELASSFRRKLLRDFTLSLTVEESYDTEPSGAEREKSGLRFRTTLVWSL